MRSFVNELHAASHRALTSLAPIELDIAPRPWVGGAIDPPVSRYFGKVPFPSRTKVNSFGGTVGPAGAFPGTAPGAGGGALGNGGNTIPWPPRKATYCFPSSIYVIG